MSYLAPYNPRTLRSLSWWLLNCRPTLVVEEIDRGISISPLYFGQLNDLFKCLMRHTCDIGPEDRFSITTCIYRLIKIRLGLGLSRSYITANYLPDKPLGLTMLHRTLSSLCLILYIFPFSGYVPPRFDFRNDNIFAGITRESGPLGRLGSTTNANSSRCLAVSYAMDATLEHQYKRQSCLQ